MHEKTVVGFSEYTNNTTVHPVGLTIILLLGLAMLCVQRRHTMLILFASASFIAVGQRIVVFGLDFGFVRVMVLFAWVRILSRSEFRPFYWNRLDSYIIAWNVATFILYVTSHGAHTMIYKLGNTFDSIGMYFLVRCLVRDMDEVKSLITSVAAIGLVVVCFFMVEYTTKRNMFSVFGGVPEITAMREGKLRCQGAYAHPILAGCFWAALCPLLAARGMYSGAGRVFYAAGFAASLLIVAFSNASTPIIGVFAAIIGFLVFPCRRSMQLVRRGVVVFLIVLQTVMVSPVYCLIARITLSGGNTGAHRVAIINGAIDHFSEWALCGTGNIDHWGIFKNDITNKYVFEAISGGLIEVTLFIMLIVTGFGNIGRLWRSVENSPADVMIAWSLGVSLFVHVTNFIGITYFGQNEMLWNVSLALTAAVPAGMTRKRSFNSVPPPAQRMNSPRRQKVIAFN